MVLDARPSTVNRGELIGISTFFKDFFFINKAHFLKSFYTSLMAHALGTCVRKMIKKCNIFNAFLKTQSFQDGIGLDFVGRFSLHFLRHTPL